VAVAALIAFNIYQKQLKEANSLKAQKEEELKKNAVLEEMSKLEKKLGAYDNLLPEKEPNTIIATISELAKAANIKIISIKPKERTEEPYFVRLPFGLEIYAPDYHALGKFVGNLESAQEVFIVGGMGIGPGREAKGLRVNLEISYIANKKR
jgi:Tfp pilus assembly protein PilO